MKELYGELLNDISSNSSLQKPDILKNFTSKTVSQKDAIVNLIRSIANNKKPLKTVECQTDKAFPYHFVEEKDS